MTKLLTGFLILVLLAAAPAAQQTINVGSSANDGTGDSPRAAGLKLNANFTELYTAVDGLTIGVEVQAFDADLSDLADGELSGSKIGTGISGTNVTTGTIAEARVHADLARDSEVAAGYQPLDADLTSIAALTTTSFGRGLLDDADASAGRTSLGLGNVENTALSTWAGSSNLTTLGTIGTGTWQGSVIGPAYLGTGSGITTKFLRGDGTWQTLSAGGDALTSGHLGQFAATTSAQLAGVLSDESGSTGVFIKTSDTTPTAGDILYFDGTDWVHLAKGTAGQALQMNSGATAPEWGAVEIVATPADLAFIAVDETDAVSTVLASTIATLTGSETLANKTLTGPTITAGTVETASGGDNDTSPASTAFVQSAARGSQTGVHATPTTTNPLAPTWTSIMHTVWYGATGEIDLPAASGYSGRSILIYNTGAFTATIDPNGSEVIVRDGTVQTGGVTMTLSSGAGNFVALISDGARWITLGYKGTLAAGS